MRRLALSAIAAVAAVGVAFGCNAIFGVNDYVVQDARDGSSDGRFGEGGEAAVDCDNFDPTTGQCYPCTPKVDIEILNTCTNAQCVPFDDKMRIPNLPDDGGLPAVPDLPPPDASSG